MPRGPGTIGPTLALALLGLPIAALAGLYWRLFPPSVSQGVPRPALDDAPVIVVDAPAKS